MKGNQNYAVFDSESDNSDHDDRDIMSFQNEKINQSIKRMKINDDSDGEDSEGGSDEDDETVDISLPEDHKETTDIIALVPGNRKIKANDQTRKEPYVSLLQLSDASRLELDDLPNKAPDSKNATTSFEIGTKYNILDGSSSSSSDDDSFNDFLRKNWRTNRDLGNSSNDRMIVPRTKMRDMKGRRTAGSPPPRSIQLQNDSADALSDQDFDSLKEASASEIGWAYNKIRREYTISEARNMPAFCLPSKLFDMLYKFQKDGVKWMAGLHVGKIGGRTRGLISLLGFTVSFEFSHLLHFIFTS
jgi:hypothetical protein